MGKTWSSGTKLCLPFGVKVNLNLSIISANSAVSPQSLLIVRKATYI